MDTPTYEQRVQGTLIGVALGESGSEGLAPTVKLHSMLYTLDGLLETLEWANEGTSADPTAAVWLSLLRWYKSQFGHFPPEAPQPLDRWIDDYQLRTEQPGETTPDSLRIPDMPLPNRPANPDASDAEAVLRGLPFGMIPNTSIGFVTSLALQADALTHGSTESSHAAAALAAIVHGIFAGADFDRALHDTLEWLSTVDQTTDLRQGLAGDTPQLENQAAQALCSAVQRFNAQQDKPFTQLLTQVDSDSAPLNRAEAAILGGFYGACYGINALPQADHWADRDVVLEAARRWVDVTT